MGITKPKEKSTMDMQTVSELNYLYKMLNNESVSTEKEQKPIIRTFTRGVVLVAIITLVLISIV